MSVVKPFNALRPPAETASKVACVPYDVIYDSEVRELVAENPLSFLRVTRAEGEFPEGEAVSHETANERARQNLEQFIRDGILVADTEKAIYIYRLGSNGQFQTGLVACCSVDEYENGTIKKHEKTRPDKVEDRTSHMLTVGAQTGLIFLAFRNTESIRNLIREAVTREPLYDFVCSAGVQQTVWRITETESWTAAFSNVPEIYIADGHHRAESAKLARELSRAKNPDHNGSEEYNFVMAGIFPAEDLNILAYNRVVHDLNGLSADEFFGKLGENFIVTETNEKTPEERGETCMYFGGRWYKLTFNVQYFREPDAIERLDVSILQQFVLTPVLGIGDPRTDTRISFVGGGRGTAELEKIVDSGEYAVAFSMFPTTMDDLFAVSDMNEIMPPKSTWFEPKLKDGLLIHQI